MVNKETLLSYLRYLSTLLIDTANSLNKSTKSENMSDFDAGRLMGYVEVLSLLLGYYYFIGVAFK